MHFTCRVSPVEQGTRLDLYLLKQGFGSTRSQVTRLIKEGRVTLKHPPSDGQPCLKAGYRVKSGDEIIVTPFEPQPSVIRPEPFPLNIVYEDDAVVVVDKPQGMVVHPAPGHTGGTLVNALLPRIKGGSPDRPGVVHRLDKGTSGLLVCVKTDKAYQSLARQFKVHSVKRLYQALVYGTVRQDSGTSAAPLGRHPGHRKKIAVRKDSGRRAVTNFRVMERFNNMTLLELRPETGRTHQIRVHLSDMGHPIVGDDLYGGKRQENRIKDPVLLERVRDLKGPALHALLLGFIHPETGTYMEFTSPPPEVFEEILSLLRKQT